MVSLEILQEFKGHFLNELRVSLNIFLALEKLCNVLLAKEKTWKRIFNTNSKLSQNRTEKAVVRFVRFIISFIVDHLYGCFSYFKGLFQYVQDSLYNLNV